MDSKVKAIVAHITLVGWIIAFVVNLNDKEELASFYIRQTLGIFITGVALSVIKIIPLLGTVVAIFGGLLLFLFWLISLIRAINGEMKPIPIIGNYFQDWFRAF